MWEPNGGAGRGGEDVDDVIFREEPVSGASQR